MDKEEDKTFVVDERLDSYAGFLESDFACQVFEASDKAKQIRHLVLHLIADWRSISYAVAFPALGPASIESFHVGMLNTGPLDYSLLGFLEFLLLRLHDRIPSLASDEQLRNEIRAELSQLITEIAPLKAERDKHVSAHAVWDQFINQRPMHMGVHSIMRLSYIGLFGSYDEFLVRSTRVLSGDAKLQSTSRDFQAILKQTFGPDMARLCWTSTQIAKIHKIRNRLVHAGGKVKEDDSVLVPLIHIEDDYMHIFPCHIKAAYLALKSPILALLTHPGFA